MAYYYRWGFPKIRGYHFGGPHNEDYCAWGSILGSPYFGKLPGWIMKPKEIEASTVRNYRGLGFSASGYSQPHLFSSIRQHISRIPRDKWTLMGSPNREPQEHSRNMPGM